MAIGRVPGATGIQPSIVDAKGDLIAATAADSVSRLAVGTNNQVLTADSAEATGLKYANEARATLTTTGDILYASAANTPARLAIGSTDQVLKVSGGVPVWAAPSAGLKSYTLLNSGGTALTGAATVTLSGISNQQALIIRIAGASSVNASADITVRFNGDTGANYTSEGNRFTSSGPALTVWDNQNETHIKLASLSSNAASDAYATLLAFGTNAAGYVSFIHTGGATTGGGSTAYNYINAGHYNASATITSVSIFSTSGNLDAGTLYVYGMAA